MNPSPALGMVADLAASGGQETLAQFLSRSARNGLLPDALNQAHNSNGNATGDHREGSMARPRKRLVYAIIFSIIITIYI